MNQQAKQFYDFGPFRIDLTERLLLREGQVVPLTPKVFDTLLVFVENSGRILNKDEALKMVWPDTLVEEANLTRNVSVLRKALGKTPDQNQYIETIPWRGYRFVVSVREVRDEAGEGDSTSAVVIEQNSGEPVRQVGFVPTVSDDSFDPDLKGRDIKRRPVSGVIAAGAALIAVLLAISFLWIRSRSRRIAPGGAIESIAVLPFKSLTPEASDEYLTVGMADTLTTRLSRIKQIIVRPFSTVQKCAAENRAPLAVGKELQVDAVLDGSIYKIEGRIRVVVRLIRMRDGASLWSENFDEKYEDLFALQDSLVKKLMAALMLNPTAEEERLFTKRHTESAEAYQTYLKGRYWWNKRTEEGFKRAIGFYNEAIALDRNYALPYAGLADCYVLMSPYGLARPKESYPKAKAAAVEALTLDNQLSEAHASLAHLTWLYEWNFPEAEAEFKQAILLDLNYPTAH